MNPQRIDWSLLGVRNYNPHGLCERHDPIACRCLSHDLQICSLFVSKN